LQVTNYCLSLPQILRPPTKRQQRIKDSLLNDVKIRLIMDKKTNELRMLQQEMTALMLKKAGITSKDLLDDAIKRWVSKNLDLLTATELKRYESVIL
jgi:hypothetical protein